MGIPFSVIYCWSPPFISIMGQKASPPPCLDCIHLRSCWAREKTQFSGYVLRQQETQDYNSSYCCKTSWNEHLIQSFKSLKHTMQNMTWRGNTWDLCCLCSTRAQEQHPKMNKAYKKLVNLCNSSFHTEGCGFRCCVMAMQNNLGDLHLASPMWESWNHSWIYHHSLPPFTKQNQNPNCRSCWWKEQRSTSRAEGWKPEEHIAQSHEITPSYLLHLFKK